MSIEPGYYNAVAKCWGLSESKNGHPQYQVEFELTSDVGDVVGTLNWWGSFANEQAEEITIQSLRDCGWKGADITRVELPNAVRVRVVEEEYDGKLRTKIKGIYPAGGAIKKMDAATEASFAERMKGRLAQIDARNARSRAEYQAGRPAGGPQQRPQGRQAPQQQQDANDDIPF